MAEPTRTDGPIYTDHLGVNIWCAHHEDLSHGNLYFVNQPIGQDPEPFYRSGPTVATLQFQNGNPHTLGINGLTNEHLLAILYHRIGVLDAKMPDQENKIAKHYVKSALTALERRTKARQARNVEGTDAP